MEPWRKSLESYICASKRQKGNLGEKEEINEALLLSPKNVQAGQPPDSEPGRSESVIEINSEAASIKEMETNNANKERKYKVSFEQVLYEAVNRRNKDLQGEASYQHPSATAFSRRNSWRSLVNLTKSRLMDLPEEHYNHEVANSSEVTCGEDSDHEDEGAEDVPGELKNKKLRASALLEWIFLLLTSVALICTFLVPVIKKQNLWDLPLWKWEVMVLALICGHLVSGWGVKLVVIIIEHSFLLRKRVLYFVYGLRKVVRNCLWLSFILFVWHWLLGGEIKEDTSSEILPALTKILVCLLVGTFVWFLKILMVKVLALNFHVNTFFERIREALFNQYVIETLLGPPLSDEEPEIKPVGDSDSDMPVPEGLSSYKIEKDIQTPSLQKCPTIGTRSRFSRTLSTKKHEQITIDDLHKLNKKNISAWIMKRMIKIARYGSLSTLDEQILNTDIQDESKLLIRSEFQAKEAAKKIFNKVASPGSQSIDIQDLIRFMDAEEASRTMHNFGAACEKEGISKSALRNWVVSVFRERKALALSLNDTKTAVDELHVLLNIFVAIIIMIIWLIIFGVPITHFLVFLSSQLVLMAFVFGNTCKTVFEAIIFLFVMHPFDVGDNCEVDGMPVIVEEMNILSTVFLRHDNQKIIYPNCVLATKPIANFHRSPDMREAIEFCVHVSTPLEKIAAAKERIKRYVDDNEELWHSEASVLVTDVEDMNKIKISLVATHRGNSQNMGERKIRRSHLVEQVIMAFKELDIEFRMLPLDVNVRNLPTPVSTRLPSN